MSFDEPLVVVEIAEFLDIWQVPRPKGGTLTPPWPGILWRPQPDCTHRLPSEVDPRAEDLEADGPTVEDREEECLTACKIARCCSLSYATLRI